MLDNVTLDELKAILMKTPVMVEMNPLSTLFLDGVLILKEVEDLIYLLDSPDPSPSQPMLALKIDHRFAHRIPALRCSHNPLTSELNKVILEKFNSIKEMMFVQSKVSDKIWWEANTECIMLILVDGLSYHDWNRFAPFKFTKRCEPCLVDGRTVTEDGMIRIIGDPPLVFRMFDSGFKRGYGFTYWEMTEPLTRKLFKGFSKMKRIRSFDDVLLELEEADLMGAYIQVIRQGLEQVCHHHKEKPDIQGGIDGIVSDLQRVINLIQRKGVRATIWMTSDHGILWRHEHELTSYMMLNSKSPPRYLDRRMPSRNTLIMESRGEYYTLLGYPLLTRELRNDEWGVHGGISFEENIVPLVKIEIED